jgi:anaerobic dimethyl sulfoxide reductase subunit B (iron-sulfur subunit)
MCIDRLVQGQMPVCVNSCPTRALDFGPLEEMKARYGDLQALAGMPDPSETRPSIVFKPASPKRQLVPYDAGKARLLFMQRSEQLPPLYPDPKIMSAVPDGLVGKDQLVMKARSTAEGLAATRSEEW